MRGGAAEADKKVETTKPLRSEIVELKAQGESGHIDFRLKLADYRNVKAAYAILSEHGNGVDKSKEAEPQLLAKHLAGCEGASDTAGLPNTGVVSEQAQADEALARDSGYRGRIRQAIGTKRADIWLTVSLP